MTNSEKYLKDGVDIGQLAREITELSLSNDDCLEDNIVMYFRQQAKATLTEAERVILRNICFTPLKDFYIERIYGTLKLHNRVDELYDFFAYDHLFQFIKEGEEYSIEELLKGE